MIMRNFRGFCVLASVVLVGVACETRIKRGDWSVCDTDYPSCVVGEYCTGENPGAGVEPWRCVMIPAGAVGFECGEVYADEDSPTKMAQVCTRKGVDGDAGTGGGGAGGSGTGMGGAGGMTGTPGCTDKAMCTDADFPHCDTNSGKCVACLMNLDCPVGRPVCDAGICKKCDDRAATDVCSARSATPVCGAKGECVECKSSAECKAEGKPICDVANGVCKGCEGNQECVDRGGTAKFCDTVSKRCVSCLTHTDCPAGTPACTGGVCGRCDNGGAAPDACSKRGGGLPVCGPAGLCVECTAAASQACVGGKPVCDANVCRSCRADTECTAAPNVCMWHDDGRCATAAETVTVVGTDLQGAVTAAVAGNKALVVVSGAADEAVFSENKKLAIVGKGTASISGGNRPGLLVSAGELFVRDLAVQSSSIGVHATGGKIILESLRIRSNLGGGVLIDNAAFEIRNCDIRDNGITVENGGTNGGIRAQNIASVQVKKLERVTVTSNENIGIWCSGTIEGTGVLATDNATAQIINPCNITACQVAGPTCGATLP